MKRFLALALCLLMAVSFVGCGEEETPSNSSPSNNTVELLDLGEGFNPDYYPVMDKVEERQGSVDVVILFEGTEGGWQAVASEYERLHGGTVAINLDNRYNSSTYTDKLRNELKDKNTNWDIVQGNLSGGDINTYGYDMQAAVKTRNAYAGNKLWKDVLEVDAYQTDKSGDNTKCFIMNSESLNTAWFVNAVAMQQAGEKGYRNANGEVATPITWDDLVSLCYYMVQAGYPDPLGLAVSTEGIGQTHFSWILRVYGDWYYREEYDFIMPHRGDQGYENLETEYKVDLTAQSPESAIDYGYVISRLYNAIYDKTGTNYVGPTSEKFKDFLNQMYKLKDYLPTDSSTLTMADLRNEFYMQGMAGGKGKEAPQIVLDYTGEGLLFTEQQTDTFKVDFFDYPMMQSNFVNPETILRDVGGNGGYLSIVNHAGDREQNELSLDFLKFFMSPYGQTIYYNALSEKKIAVKGLTTVKNNLILIPDAWKEYFNSDKISFTGLADSNPFVACLVRYADSRETDNVNEGISLWKRYLTGVGTDAISTDEFANLWYNSCFTAFGKVGEREGWSKDFYKFPGQPTNYTEL